jgi:hypothetical protein
MQPISGSDRHLVTIVAICGSIFFLLVCAAIYLIFKRLQRSEDEQKRKDELASTHQQVKTTEFEEVG